MPLLKEGKTPSVGGNVVHVNDLVDNVALESEVAGTGADLVATDELLG